MASSTSSPAKAVLLAYSLGFVLAAGACSGSEQAATVGPDEGRALERDADAVRLIEIANVATELVREYAANPILRRFRASSAMGPFYFEFTNEAATQMMAVGVTDPTTPQDEWTIDLGLPIDPHYVGRPNLKTELEELLVGPRSVEIAALGHWPDCGMVEGMQPETYGKKPIWRVWCNVPGGVASGSVDARTGAFMSDGVAQPPAITPPRESAPSSSTPSS